MPSILAFKTARRADAFKRRPSTRAAHGGITHRRRYGARQPAIYFFAFSPRSTSRHLFKTYLRERTNQAGGLKQINKQYKAYRQAQIARAEKAVPYSKFLELRYTVSIVRNVAATGRAI
jgi:hypothetical protein